MSFIRQFLRYGFDWAERVLGQIFAAEWNPLLNLGALGFFFYWVITASGIYVYIFFDTGVKEAYASVEYMTHEQWYLAGVMRSLHRYASDGLVVVMLVHIVREFSRDRYRGVRWFSWITGVPILIFVFAAGITGYWLVWDKLAQYVALVTTEWLDRLPIFGEPIARNFLSPATLDSRFFTLMVFMHIAVPLIALIILWIHLQRVIKPRINPPRGLAIGIFLSMLVLSLVHPALSQGPANLAEVPGTLGLDWFYLPLYPILETWPGLVTWGAAGTLLLTMLALPWLPAMRKPAAAVVNLDNCNGCVRCFNDCPYSAISIVPRTDGLPFERQAEVNPSLCVACGICAGACPTSTPFRRTTGLVPGIDLPDMSMASLRDELTAAGNHLQGPSKLIIFGCEHGPSIDASKAGNVALIRLRCIGQLPPSFIDYVLSRKLADGVVLAGCSENSCQARFGIAWTKARLNRERDPYLRRRVPRNRVKTIWTGRLGRRKLAQLVTRFTAELAEDESLEPPETAAEKHAIKAKELVYD